MKALWRFPAVHLHPSLRCKGSSPASTVKVLTQSTNSVVSLGNWSFQWRMIWPSSLDSWGSFVFPWPAGLLSEALAALINSSMPDPSQFASIVCEMPKPSLSAWCSLSVSSHAAPFLQPVLHTSLFLTLLFPCLVLSSLVCSMALIFPCVCVCDNNFSSQKIRWDELVMWQIKYKQCQKAILKYLSLSLYSSTGWITWVIKCVEEKNLMEMIIWLVPVILTNQAYQLRTSRLSKCLWGFLFYYLKLIKHLIVGPYVPFYTADAWSE